MKLSQLCLALGFALGSTVGSTAWAQTSQGKCRLVAQACVDGPSTKVINGVAVWQPCWNYSQTYTCLDPNVADYCNPLKRPDCEVQGQECLERAATGECMRYEHKYSCDVDIKKVHGGTLPQGITEEAPTHLITQEWDTAECDAKKAAFASCTVISETCLEGPATKEINGVPVTRDCWKKEQQYQCSGQTVSQCEELEQKGCRLKDQTCISRFPDGSCQVDDRVYVCTVSEEHEETVSQCQDRDFAKAMTNMEVAREIGRYFDIDSQTFFKGDPSFCSVKLGGALDGLLGGDCCQPQGDPGDFKDYAVQAGTQLAMEYGVGSLGSSYTYSVLSFNAPEFITSSISAAEGFASSFGAGASGGPPLSFMGFGVSTSAGGGLVVTFDPTSFAIAIAIMALQQWLACEQEETVTVFRREADLCHSVGSYCSTDTPLGCVEKTQTYCCYISKLAKIVNEQGKPQLGRDFGTPESPDCNGFFAQDLEQLDFSKMDLSEFFEDIRSRMPNTNDMMTRINQTAEQKAQEAKDNIKDNYYDQ